MMVRLRNRRLRRTITSEQLHISPAAICYCVHTSPRCERSRLSVAGRQKLRERADDAVGFHGRTWRQAVAMDVHPDGIDAEPLRRLDFPFEVVADHPGIPGADAECFHRMQIGALLRLAETMLALDLDMMEAMRELEALDLGA